MNNSPPFCTDDFFYTQKEHLNSSSDNMNHFSLSGRPCTSILTGFSDHYNQNLISSIPHQNSNLLNWDTQNHSFFKFPTNEIPSNNPFMGITSDSNINVSNEVFNNKTNDQELLMIYNTPFTTESRGLSENFQGNTMWDGIVHNQGFNIDSQEPALDQIMVESQLFDLFAPDGIKGKTKEAINEGQDRMTIKIDQKKNNKVQVKSRKSSKKSNMIKGQWTNVEDRMLMQLVNRNGPTQWTCIAKMFKGRVGKQCRERWHNHLRPNIKKNSWSEVEDQILIEAHKIVGNKWTEIAQMLPGRSENIVKNHWNATKRRLYTMKAKRNDETAFPSHGNALQNYIKSITITDDLLKTDETIHVTVNSNEIVDEVMDLSTQAATTMMDESTTEAYVPDENTPVTVNTNDIVDGMMNLSMQAATTVMDESTTEAYVPVPATPIWEDDFTDLFGPMDENHGCSLWDNDFADVFGAMDENHGCS